MMATPHASLSPHFPSIAQQKCEPTILVKSAFIPVFQIIVNVSLINILICNISKNLIKSTNLAPKTKLQTTNIQPFLQQNAIHKSIWAQSAVYKYN